MDDSAFLSALMQAGATLVAIVGGLLVARLVALAGERQTLERRIKELSNLVNERRASFKTAHQALIEDNGNTFAWNIIDEIIEEPGVSFDELYNKYGTGKNRDDLLPYYEKVRNEIANVVGELEIESKVDQPVRLWIGNLRDRVENEFNNPLRREIAHLILDEFDPSYNSIAGIPQKYTRFASMGQTSDSVEHQALVLNDSNSFSDLQNTEFELRHSRGALDFQSNPQGLLKEAIVLAAITICGVVIPLIAMAFGESANSVRPRLVYSAIFIVSLMIFFWYIFDAIRRILSGGEDNRNQDLTSSLA